MLRGAPLIELLRPLEKAAEDFGLLKKRLFCCDPSSATLQKTEGTCMIDFLLRVNCTKPRGCLTANSGNSLIDFIFSWSRSRKLVYFLMNFFWESRSVALFVVARSGAWGNMCYLSKLPPPVLKSLAPVNTRLADLLIFIAAFLFS